MLSAVLLQSTGQGTGKSSIGLCIGEMYGNNYKLIDDTQLHGSFNEWAVNKQFILERRKQLREETKNKDRLRSKK